jgi:probable FeS assembly SUF system protein SufT
MTTQNPVKLKRSVKGVQIPSGVVEELSAGREVVVTQSLGGSFTVACTDSGYLYRVGAEDAEALGLKAPAEAAAAVPADSVGSLQDRVWAALKTCYDPEIPVNIVDLGLIYSMEVKGRTCAVKMTLTAQGCGMGPVIAADARQKIQSLPEIDEAAVDVVWDPPWNPSMITPDGKKKLGIAE